MTIQKKIESMGDRKEFFGLKPGQTLSELRDEMKQLSDHDRRELSLKMVIERSIDHEPAI